MQRGDVIVTPAGAPKHWRSDEPREWLAIRLPPSFLQAIVPEDSRDGSAMLVDNFGTRDPVVESIGQRLLGELEDPGIGSDVYGSALVHELGVHLLRHYSNAPATIPARAKLPEHKLRRAREFIDAHLGEELTVGRIAEVVAMSPCHFAHLFRDATGQPPHSFVIQRRIERAKYLLIASELPMMEIAQLVGCQTQAHFSAVFRRHAGVSPSAFRISRGTGTAR